MSFILTVLAAVLLTAANYYGGLYFLSWFAFLPFLYYLYLYSSEINYKKIFFSGWNLGFWILLFSGNFIYHSIKLYTSAPIVIILLLMILLFLLLSLIYALFLLLYFYLQQKLFTQNKFRPFLFACCWTLLEFSRYYLLGFFPIANPAYTQADFLGFIQLADLGGIWILTFVLILVNALLFQLIFQKNYKSIFVLSLILIISFSFSYSLQQKNFAAERAAERNEAFRIGIITTQIEQEKKWSSAQLDKNIKLALNAAAELNQTQLIIAPETNLTFDFHANRYYQQQFLDEVAEKFKTPIQIGSLAAKDSIGGRYNSSYLISEQGEIISRYDKNLLLYFGETYPFLEILNKYTPYNFSSLNPGEDVNLFKSKNLQWKTVICSEILYPNYVKPKTGKIDFIVNQTNEAWFKDSRLLKNIMWQAAVIRAVENRIPVVKTGNQAYNGIIYASGEYQKVDSRDNYHILNLN